MTKHKELADGCLVGKRVKSVHYASKEEARSNYWSYSPLVIVFEDDSFICPMSDDEGNEAGALLYGSPSTRNGRGSVVFPVIR